MSGLEFLFIQLQKEEVRTLTGHLEKQIEETESLHRSKIENLEAELMKLHEEVSTVKREKDDALSELFNSREETENLRERVIYSIFHALQKLISHHIYFEYNSMFSSPYKYSKINNLT